MHKVLERVLGKPAGIFNPGEIISEVLPQKEIRPFHIQAA
jgi:hypothetical protein